MVVGALWLRDCRDGAYYVIGRFLLLLMSDLRARARVLAVVIVVLATIRFRSQPRRLRFATTHSSPPATIRYRSS